MKLTYIINYLSADDAQHFVHIPRLLREMEKLGWDIDLLSERGGHGIADVFGCRVFYLSNSSKFLRLGRMLAHLLRMRRRGGKLVFVRISKFAAFVSALFGRILGWQTVYWVSGTVEDFNEQAGLRGKLAVTGMRLLLRLVDRLATGPEQMVRYYSAFYGLPPEKLLLLYNDVDFANASHTPVASTRPSKILLVHRLSPVRDTARYFPALLDALTRYQRISDEPVFLDVCGDGPERPLLERLTKDIVPGVTVTFHGAVPQRDLATFYESAEIFLMPSYREGFPRVMLEAMAHALPIVATDAGGTRDLCGPLQQDYIVNRNDPVAFGSAVERLLGSASDRTALAAENMVSVQRFDTASVARMYDRALAGLINAPAAR